MFGGWAGGRCGGGGGAYGLLVLPFAHVSMIKDKHDKGQEGAAASSGGAGAAAVVEAIKKEDADTTTVTTTTSSDKKCAVPQNGTTAATTLGPTGGVALVECKVESEADVKETKVAGATVGGGGGCVPLQAPHIKSSTDCLDADDPFAMSLGTMQAPSAVDGVQSLASNVLPKQQAPGSMEAQYMQQQSQIFVFSTVLANSAAEEMLQGHYPSIIAYHCAQPGTKKYLEKNPLKVTQFIRHNPAQWLNNLNMMKKGGNNVCSPRSPPMKCGMVSGGSSSPLVGGPPNAQTPQLSGSSSQPSTSLPPSDSGSTTSSLVDQFLPDGLDDMVGLGDGDMAWDQPSQSSHPTPTSNCMDPTSVPLPNGLTNDMSCLHQRTSLQGVKVPDENLTPQQRKHREVQLATLRKMAEIFFREDNDPNAAAQTPSNGGPPGGCGGGGGVAHNMDPSQMSNNDWYKMTQQQQQQQQQPQQQQPPPQSARLLQPYPQPSCAVVSSSDPGCKSMNTVTSSTGSPISTTCNANRNMPVVTAATTTSNLGIGPPVRLHGPPPPYHQTQRSASVPIALQSPNPMSPNNNPTSNLSLPSPRALNSPDTRVGLNTTPQTFSSNGSNNSNSGTPNQRPNTTQSGGTVHSVGSPRMPPGNNAQSSTVQTHSNPGTPIAQAHLSPSVTNSNGGANSTSQNTTNEQQVSSTITSTTGIILPTGGVPSNHQGNDSVFGRNMHPMNQPLKHPQLQQMSNNSTNSNINVSTSNNACHPATTAAPLSCQSNVVASTQEPNLMPVPSPQQIQYLNAFEGQELIIQKQPNTSLNDKNIVSPPIMPTTLDSGFSNNNMPLDMVPHTRLSGSNTPTSMDNAMVIGSGPSVSSSRFQHLPGEGCRYQIPSPHAPINQNPNPPDKSRLAIDNVPLNPNCATNMGVPMSGMVTKAVPSHGMGLPSHGMGVPNHGIGVAVSSTQHSHFDPISSLVQMSQQLTNSVSSHSLNGQAHPHGQPHPHPHQPIPPPHPQQTGPPAPPSAPHPHLHPHYPHQMMNHYVGSPMSHMLDMGGPPNNVPASHCMPDMDGNHVMPGPAPPHHSMHPAHLHQQHHGFHGPGGNPKIGPPFGPPSSLPMPRTMHRTGPPVPPPPNHLHNQPHLHAHVHHNPYNGANIQVKPNAPNTIQYLPVKSQTGNNATGTSSQPPNTMANVCPQPRLDFLHRFQNSSDPNKIPSHNLQYFPNSGSGHMPPMGAEEPPNQTLPPQAAMMRPGPMPPHNPHFHPQQPPVQHHQPPPQQQQQQQQLQGPPTGMRPMMRMPHYNGPTHPHHHAMDGPYARS